MFPKPAARHEHGSDGLRAGGALAERRALECVLQLGNVLDVSQRRAAEAQLRSRPRPR